MCPSQSQSSTLRRQTKNSDNANPQSSLNNQSINDNSSNDQNRPPTSSQKRKAQEKQYQNDLKELINIKRQRNRLEQRVRQMAREIQANDRQILRKEIIVESMQHHLDRFAIRRMCMKVAQSQAAMQLIRRQTDLTVEELARRIERVLAEQGAIRTQINADNLIRSESAIESVINMAEAGREGHEQDPHRYEINRMRLHIGIESGSFLGGGRFLQNMIDGIMEGMSDHEDNDNDSNGNDESSRRDRDRDRDREREIERNRERERERNRYSRTQNIREREGVRIVDRNRRRGIIYMANGNRERESNNGSVDRNLNIININANNDNNAVSGVNGSDPHSQPQSQHQPQPQRISTLSSILNPLPSSSTLSTTINQFQSQSQPSLQRIISLNLQDSVDNTENSSNTSINGYYYQDYSSLSQSVPQFSTFQYPSLQTIPSRQENSLQVAMLSNGQIIFINGGSVSIPSSSETVENAAHQLHHHIYLDGSRISIGGNIDIIIGEEPSQHQQRQLEQQRQQSQQRQQVQQRQQQRSRQQQQQNNVVQHINDIINDVKEDEKQQEQK